MMIAIKNNIKWIVLTVAMALAGLAALYFSFSNVYGHRRPAPTAGKNDYLTEINSYSQFMAIQGAPLASKMSNVFSVKLLQDAASGQLYFINSVKYRYHYDFCRLVMGDDMALELFNAINYGRTLQRKYVLACLNYHRQSGIYTIEFTSEDQASPKMLRELVAATQRHVSMRDSVRLFISSEYLLAMDKAGKLEGIPRVYPADVYKAQKFQPLNEGTAYGVLALADSLPASVDTRKCIVLMKGSPVNVPVCAAIITNTLQSPLSHINVLCHNRNIPSAADVGIYQRPEVKAGIGRPVKVTVSSTGIIITPCTLRQVDSFAASQATSKTPVSLTCNITYADLLPIKKAGHKWAHVIGNKAAGMAELAKVAAKWNSKFSVPEGAFAIPFHYYNAHISQPAVRAELDALVKLEAAHAPKATTDAQLKKVRQAIKNQPIDPALLNNVLRQVQANGEWTAYRFRSSSNAEDAKGFSGAGLYESRTGKVGDSAKPIDEAIKKVWASTYSEAAYYERRACNIVERTMMMGILAHRSFPDEAANGVAITQNIYRKNFPGFTVNVQAGEVPVVAPPDSVICEQFVCMKGNTVDLTNFDVVVEYLTTSNLTGNRPVLDNKQITQLYNALEAVRSHFYYNIAGNANDEHGPALDIEFKFDKNGRLYLKQVRPYR